MKKWRKTWKNKLGGLALIGAGMLPVLLDGDGTFLLFALIIGFYLLIAKENVIS